MDDLSGKISEIFSNPESMEMIKNLVGMLGGGQEGSHEEQKQPSAADTSGGMHTDTPGGSPGGAQGNTSGGMPGDFPFDADTMLKMTKALSLIKKDDPRVAFLMALRPNLSGDRQKKVDEAIHLLKLVNLIPLLQEGLLQ